MNIVYYTSGVSGTGRLVRGLAIKNALIRRNLDVNFTILHSAPEAGFLGESGHIRLPLETVRQTDSKHYENSAVYSRLLRLSADLLIVDLLWVPLHSFLEKLPCRKIFLARQVSPDFFVFEDEGLSLRFNPAQYDHIITIEPSPYSVSGEHIDPIVIRNRDEIFSREKAIGLLGLDSRKKHCLFSLNRTEEVFNESKKNYAYLKDDGYEMYSTTLYNNGVFPIADYFNAFDLVVCGGGYNAFWETVFFGKEAIFVPKKARYENAWWRIENCRDYRFKMNGADELVDVILRLFS